MNDTTNTTDAQVAAQNAEAANANVGETTAASPSVTSATAASAASGNTAAQPADGLTANNPAASPGALSGSNLAGVATAAPASPEIAPLAGTSGKASGTNTTGMAAAGNAPKKLTPATVVAKTPGANAGLDSSAANVNVRTPANATHPIVATVQSRVAELKTIVEQQEKTPWINRAVTDLRTFEEWVVQHFEEMKRKV